MTRRLVAAIAAVLAMFAGLAVAAAPFGLAVQRSGHWSRPTTVNVATGGGIALVGLLGFLFATAGLVSHLRRRGLLTPDPPPTTHRAPLPPPAAPAPVPVPPPVPAATPNPAPPPQAETTQAETTRVGEARAQDVRAQAASGEATQAEPPPATAGGPVPAGGYVRPAGEEGAGTGFPRRPTMQRDGVLGSEWDGFLQPRTASPADLIQGVQAARDPDRDLPPQAAQAAQAAQPSLASPPPGAGGSTGSLAGARPYIVGPYQVGRAPGTGSPERGTRSTGYPDNGATEHDTPSEPTAATTDQEQPVRPPVAQEPDIPEQAAAEPVEEKKEVDGER
jgi:hypothetical protein